MNGAMELYSRVPQDVYKRQGLCSALDGSDGRLHVLITNHDVQEHTLDAAGIIHPTTVNASLAHFTLKMCIRDSIS